MTEPAAPWQLRLLGLALVLLTHGLLSLLDQFDDRGNLVLGLGHDLRDGLVAVVGPDVLLDLKGFEPAVKNLAPRTVASGDATALPTILKRDFLPQPRTAVDTAVVFFNRHRDLPLARLGGTGFRKPLDALERLLQVFVRQGVIVQTTFQKRLITGQVHQSVAAPVHDDNFCLAFFLALFGFANGRGRRFVEPRDWFRAKAFYQSPTHK